MSAEHGENLDLRMQSALEELRGVIGVRYPGATFAVARDRDEPDNVDLLTTVDLEDPDEVLDLVLDRLIQLQVEERIPVHVIPMRTPERILAELKGERKPDRFRRLHSVVGRSASTTETDL